MTLNYGNEFFPEPFPDGLPTINLEKISLAKLLSDDEPESRRLFDACRDKGFCYLDLTTHEKGMKLVDDAQQVHRASKKAFKMTPIAEKREFKTRPAHTGLLDTGYGFMIFFEPISCYAGTERPVATKGANHSNWRCLMYGPMTCLRGFRWYTDEVFEI